MKKYFANIILPINCLHCGSPKENPYGLCSNCGKFPTKLHLDMITQQKETIEEAAEIAYQNAINPDTSKYECFFHYTDEMIFKAGFEQGYNYAKNQ